MGFGVCGHNPTSKVGKCFRNNCWWWRPLWIYCNEVAPDIIDEQTEKFGHFNEAYGLGADGARALAERLRDRLASGHCLEFERDWRIRQETAPDVECDSCGGTGIRKPPPQGGPGDERCGFCSGTGTHPDLINCYPFDSVNVANFAAFLEDCGGFSIE